MGSSRSPRVSPTSRFVKGVSDQCFGMGPVVVDFFTAILVAVPAGAAADAAADAAAGAAAGVAADAAADRAADGAADGSFVSYMRCDLFFAAMSSLLLETEIASAGIRAKTLAFVTAEHAFSRASKRGCQWQRLK